MNKLIKPYQLTQLVSAFLKELIREPEVLFWGIGFPILMSLGLGIAFTKKADLVISVAVVAVQGSDNQPDAKRSGIERFLEKNAEIVPGIDDSAVRYKIVIENDKMGNTIFFFRKTSWEAGLTLLKRGLLSMIITEKDGQIHYHFDPLNPTAQLTYLKLTGILSGNAIQTSESPSNVEPLTVSGSRYIDFFVPGLIAMGIMMSSMWGLSYRIIEMRSQKLLRRMVATPMKKSHLLIAMILVRTLMNFEALLLFLFAFLVFDIRIQGNLLALLMIFLAGNIAFSGIAVFISSRTAKTEIGNALINIVVMPMMVLSGIFFSYHNFPDWAVPVIQKFPLTMLADGIRSVFIEGAGLDDITLPFFFLLSIGIAFFTVGLKMFKWH